MAAQFESDLAAGGPISHLPAPVPGTDADAYAFPDTVVASTGLFSTTSATSRSEPSKRMPRDRDGETGTDERRTASYLYEAHSRPWTADGDAGHRVW